MYCEYCHGSGEITDYVPYGDTWVTMVQACECQDELEEDEDAE